MNIILQVNINGTAFNIGDTVYLEDKAYTLCMVRGNVVLRSKTGDMISVSEKITKYPIVIEERTKADLPQDLVEEYEELFLKDGDDKIYELTLSLPYGVVSCHLGFIVDSDIEMYVDEYDIVEPAPILKVLQCVLELDDNIIIRVMDIIDEDTDTEDLILNHPRVEEINKKCTECLEKIKEWGRKNSTNYNEELFFEIYNNEI